MKKFYTILCLVIITTTQLQAQAPHGFNYQATVRNSSGDLILNQNVYFKFNIMQGSQTSVPIFNEVHYVPTDDLGQVNLVIGQGTPTTGSFSQIDWSQGSYFLGIELDTGNGYTAMGTTQLLSVPFALYAENAGNGNISNPNLESVLAENNSANSQQIKDLQDPTEAQDAATKAYIDALIANLQTQIENLSSGSNPTNDSGSISDIDGNSYNYNTYGDFQWTLENAQMVTYRDGTPIPQVTDPNQWSQLTTGAWCYHNNDPTKGMLYNWYAVAGIHDNDPNTPNKELAPDGWQVPTDIEWTSLEEHLIANGYNYDGTTTGNKIAKAMASASGWNSSDNPGSPGLNQDVNNSSGFDSYPYTDRSYDGTFSFNLGSHTNFWTLTENNSVSSLDRTLNSDFYNLISGISHKGYGFSVRFVRNLGDSSGNDPVNEQEIITTVEVTLTGTNGIEFVLSWEDIDGDGPNVPVVVGASIPAGNYAGDIQLYNKTLNPSDDGYIVTNEILEEDLDHQFFYFAPNGLDAIFTYNDSDSNGNPVGQQFNLTANSGTGEFRLVMIYEPDKTGNGVSDGDITNAGGETDVDIFFPITVEGNIDTTPPVINLIGDSTIELFIGDTYEDTGATAIDDTDGDITSLIIVDASSVNTAVVGTYIVTYNVSDAAGNDATEVSRTINVIAASGQIYSYSTFDQQPLGFGGGFSTSASQAFNLHQDLSNISQIKMFLQIDCPTTGCDDWDRFANIKVKDQATGSWFEIGRYVTPYWVGTQLLDRGLEFDVTDFKSLLNGNDVELRVYIENYTAKADLVSLEFDYIEGTPDYPFYAVSEVLGFHNNSIDSVPYGVSHSEDLDKSVQIPNNAESSHLRTVISGWGHTTPVDSDGRPCAEWCFRTHDVNINGSSLFQHYMGPIGCATNPINNQAPGNWTPDRAGWCPGMVVPVRVNNLETTYSGSSFAFEYDFEDWTSDGGTTSGQTGAYYAISTYIVVKSNTQISNPLVN